MTQHPKQSAAPTDVNVHPALTAVGLTLDFNPAWPIYAVDEATSHQRYQPIGESSGIVFVRYGSADTLDSYLTALGGTRPAQIERDEHVIHRGFQARRVQALLSGGGGEIYTTSSHATEHHAEPTTRDRIVVIGFEARGIPVLLGYRIPEAALAQHATALEAILDSVRTQ